VRILFLSWKEMRHFGFVHCFQPLSHILPVWNHKQTMFTTPSSFGLSGCAYAQKLNRAWRINTFVSKIPSPITTHLLLWFCHILLVHATDDTACGRAMKPKSVHQCYSTLNTQAKLEVCLHVQSYFIVVTALVN
jgi:hypothetical protein